MGLVNPTMGKQIFPPVNIYKIKHSALFEGGQYLSRTFTSSGPGDIWSYSQWIKFGDTNNLLLLTANNGGNADTDRGDIFFDGNKNLSVVSRNATAVNVRFDCSFIDQTSHGHVYVEYDTTQATASDRVRAWWNGIELPITGSPTYPALNYTGFAIDKNMAHFLYNGGDHNYASEVIFTSGTKADLSNLGQSSLVVTGLWVPQDPSGLIVGTNGFYLGFTDALNLGKDVSGQGNDWGTSGAPFQTKDTPTDNYPILNPLTSRVSWPDASLTNGGLTISSPDGKGYNFNATNSPVNSGKWAFGATLDSLVGGSCWVGIRNIDTGGIYGIYWLNGGGQMQKIGPTIFDVVPYGPATTSIGDYGELYFDLDTGIISAKVNTIDYGTVFSGLNGNFVPFVESGNVTGLTLDFGSTGTTFTPDFNSLNTDNLPEPNIIRSSRFADIAMRLGTGSASSVSTLEFKPDWVNGKDRDNSRSWAMFDSLNLATNYLQTDTNSALSTDAQSLLSFDSNGYSLGTSSVMNHSGANFIDLSLKTGVSQGFEILQYTGNGIAGRTVSHNLGRAPTFIIVKSIDTLQNWLCYHIALGATKSITLNTQDSATTNPNAWNDTEPTNSIITLGVDPGVNADGTNYVMYLFTDSDIFKSFSYTGNGNTDGPFINLGGKPLSIPFLKDTDTSTNWFTYDARRNTCNPVEARIFPNDPRAEVSGTFWPFFTSSGIKIGSTTANNAFNNNGNLIIGLAIIKSTFKYSNAY